MQALGVVPHAVAVDDAGAGAFGDANHAAVDVGRHAEDEVLRHAGAQAVDGPGLLDGVDAAADAARGDDDGGAAQLKAVDGGTVGGQPAGRVVGVEDAAAHAHGPPRGLVDDQLVDDVAELELHEAPGGGLLDGLGEYADDLGPGAPCEVEPGHRVAVAVSPAVAPLGPADVEEEAHAPRLDVGLHLVGGEVDKGLCPSARPVVVLLTVEGGAAEPVLHGEGARVADAHAALLGRVDDEDAAERPKGLAAQVVLVLLIQQHDGHVALRQLEGGHEAGEACADDEHGRLGFGLGRGHDGYGGWIGALNPG